MLICLIPACAPSPDTAAARQRQMYGLVQKFDRFDGNGDGYLTRDELVRGVNGGGSLHLTEEEIDRVMRAYDLNGDERISQRESQRAADRGPEIFGDEPL
jgi:Ca2+-binding EF-hand superfamily protein